MRRLIFLHLGRRLGGILMVRGEKEPPTVRLTPTGTVIGRLLDGDGHALAGVEIDLAFDDGDARYFYQRLDPDRPLIRTDKEGRFRIEGVVPGLKFGLSVRLVKASDLPPNSCGMSTYDVKSLVGEIDVLQSDEYVNLPGCLDGVEIPKDQLNTVIHEVCSHKGPIQ